MNLAVPLPALWPGHFRSLPELIYHRARVHLFQATVGSVRRPASPLAVQRTSVIPESSPLQIAMIRAERWNEAAIRERRKQKDVCYYVEDHGKCVHFSWVTRVMMNVSETDLSVRLMDQHCWIYSCYTDSSMRGQGLFPQVLACMVDDFFGAGGKVAWIGALEENISSRRAILKAGFKKVGQIEKTSYFSIFDRFQLISDMAS